MKSSFSVDGVIAISGAVHEQGGALAGEFDSVMANFDAAAINKKSNRLALFDDLEGASQTYGSAADNLSNALTAPMSDLERINAVNKASMEVQGSTGIFNVAANVANNFKQTVGKVLDNK